LGDDAVGSQPAAFRASPGPGPLADSRSFEFGEAGRPGL